MEALARIRRWASVHNPGWQLNPGADMREIERAEQGMGLAFPADLKEYLLVADGQTDTSTSLIGDWDFLPLEQIVQSWRAQRRMLRQGLFSGNKNEATATVKGRWWNSGWIPILHSSAGDYYCLDTDPNDAGTPGQVIVFWHDESYRPLVALSLGEWLAHIAADMESGRYNWVTPQDSYGPANNGFFIQSSRQDWRGIDLPLQWRRWARRNPTGSPRERRGRRRRNGRWPKHHPPLCGP